MCFKTSLEDEGEANTLEKVRVRLWAISIVEWDHYLERMFSSVRG